MLVAKSPHVFLQATGLCQKCWDRMLSIFVNLKNHSKSAIRNTDLNFENPCLLFENSRNPSSSHHLGGDGGWWGFGRTWFCSQKWKAEYESRVSWYVVYLSQSQCLLTNQFHNFNFSQHCCWKEMERRVSWYVVYLSHSQCSWREATRNNLRWRKSFTAPKIS